MKLLRKPFGWLCLASLLTLTTAVGAAESPGAESNGSWIALSGTVTVTTKDAFRLDYGGGSITVEMDDFDFFHEGRKLLENDRVTVFGRVDADLFEARSIEARSVYVENLGTHFYASPADEEGFSSWTLAAPIRVGEAQLTGHVTSVQGREFTFDTGRREITVDTSDLAYNPMDDHGFLKIDRGDLVKVVGRVQTTLFEDRELHAEWLAELHD